MRTPDGLPLRPLTLGELLDAAVSLLRTHAGPLLALAVPLVLLEQFALMPLRLAARLELPYSWPVHGNVAEWWAITALGFATEAVILTLLGAVAAAAAGPAMVGVDVRGRALWRTVRPVATICAAVLVGAVAGCAAYLGFLPWIFLYGLFGLVAPALVIDRVGNPFSAVARSARLASSNGMRAAWYRLAGYTGWLVIRFALGAGWSQVLDIFAPADPAWLPWLSGAAWLLADVVAYSALACLDAVLLLEARIRTEALDLTVGRARRLGLDPVGALRVVR